MHFLMLGALEVRSETARIPITAPKQRAILATLLLDANNEVSIEQLERAVWDDDPPAAARTTLQSYIYRLRQLLRPIPSIDLRTFSASYTLHVDTEDTDLGVFRAKVASTRERIRTGDPTSAVENLRAALSIWRGNALSGIPGRYIQQQAKFLEGERIAAIEELYAREIALGSHRDVIPELQRLTAAYPFHETLHAQLVVALYRSGRQAEALAAYSAVRRRLRDELGVEPGRDLQLLHQAVLEQTPVPELSPLIPAC